MQQNRPQTHFLELGELELIHRDEESGYMMLRDQAGNYVVESVDADRVKRRQMTRADARTWLIYNVMPLSALELFHGQNIILKK